MINRACKTLLQDISMRVANQLITLQVLGAVVTLPLVIWLSQSA